MIETHSLDSLSDRDLLCRFRDLVQRDCEGNADLLRHIDVIDRRKLWAKQGHPSLFDFLCVRYHMSESTAGKRVGAARTARRFPVLFGMIARGEIHLSGIHCLKAHLTPENHAEVLAQAKHKTIRQIERLVAYLAPQPDVPSTLRALPRQRDSGPPRAATPAPGPPALAATPTPTPGATLAETPAPVPLPVPVIVPRRAPDPAPLSPGRYKLQVTLSESAKDKLKQLQDLLAHQIPNGDPAPIIERALEALLTQVHQQKTGIAARPRVRQRTTPVSPKTRRLQVAIRREVWPRDEGRCGFISEDGHRCNETRGLEFAHVYPRGKGGDDSVPNVGLRCMAHNAYEADRDYGTSFMASKRRRKVPKKPLTVREPLASYVHAAVVGRDGAEPERARES